MSGPQDKRTPAYVFAECPGVLGETRLDTIRTALIADACARFLRATDRSVLFSLGFDTFGAFSGSDTEQENPALPEFAQRWYLRMQSQLEDLGCSCDWERSFTSSEPEYYRWTQWLFLKLLERDLIYQQGGRWLLRMDRYIHRVEESVTLAGWDDAAMALQRAAMGCVRGAELHASVVGGGELVVFTPYPDAIAKATFVAISPADARIAQWTTDPGVVEQVVAMREVETDFGDGAAEDVPMVITDALAVVPGVPGLLPVVVSPLVDARFGPTAILGIPESDATDRRIAEHLPPPAGTGWKMASSDVRPQPAVRYRMRDFPVSQTRRWGTPLPLINCDVCGVVPVTLKELPVRLACKVAGREGEDATSNSECEECICPRCDNPAVRETGSVDNRLDKMWMWMAMCVPLENRASAMMSDSEYARWLPVEQVVTRADMASRMFERRLFAEALRDVGVALPDRELFSKAFMHEGVGAKEATIEEGMEREIALEQLIDCVGSDSVRLAMFYAASPRCRFTWGQQPLRYSHRFLHRLYDYAEPRLRAWAQLANRVAGSESIDPSDKTRRRLAHWSAVACERVTLNLRDLELQRAAHNAMRLLTRIQDFESIVSARGEINARDRDAIVFALLLLVRLLAPLTPYISEELWAVAGNTTLVGEAGWPDLQRPNMGRADASASQI